MIYEPIEEHVYMTANGQQETAKIVQSKQDFRIIFFNDKSEDILPAETYMKNYPDLPAAKAALKLLIEQ